MTKTPPVFVDAKEFQHEQNEHKNTFLNSNPLLFNTTKFHHYTYYELIDIQNRIDDLQKDDFDETPLEELAYDILIEYKKDFPKVLFNEIYMSPPQDIKLSIQKKSDSLVKIEGTRITLFIPVEGDATLLRIYPSDAGIKNCNTKTLGSLMNYFSNLPYGEITENAIKVTYEIAYNENHEEVKDLFNSNLEMIKLHLDYLYYNFTDYNEKLPEVIKRNLIKRNQRLCKDIEIATSFGFPIK